MSALDDLRTNLRTFLEPEQAEEAFGLMEAYLKSRPVPSQDPADAIKRALAEHVWLADDTSACSCGWSPEGWSELDADTYGEWDSVYLEFGQHQTEQVQEALGKAPVVLTTRQLELAREAFAASWEDENKKTIIGFRRPGTRTRAGLRAAFKAVGIEVDE